MAHGLGDNFSHDVSGPLKDIEDVGEFGVDASALAAKTLDDFSGCGLNVVGLPSQVGRYRCQIRNCGLNLGPGSRKNLAYPVENGFSSFDKAQDRGTQLFNLIAHGAN